MIESLWVFDRADFQRYTTNRWETQNLTYNQALQFFFTYHTDYVQIIGLHPYFAELYLKTGIFWMYYIMKHIEESAQFFESILQFYPTNPHALFHLANHHYKSKQAEKALEYYAIFLENYPNQLPSPELSSLYKDFFHLKISFPTTFNVYQNMAYCYQHLLKDEEKALDYYRKANTYSPQNAAFDFAGFAKLLWKYEGNRELALKVVEEGLTILEQQNNSREGFFGMMPLEWMKRKQDLRDLIEELTS